MSTRTAIGYAAAGVIVAASTVTATFATLGLGGGTEAMIAGPIPIATASAEQALVITPGGSTITLAPGEQLASSEIVQTPAGPVEFLYVDAARFRGREDDDDDEERERSSSRGHDEDDDGGHDDEDDDHDDDRRESRSSIRGDRR